MLSIALVGRFRATSFLGYKSCWNSYWLLGTIAVGSLNLSQDGGLDFCIKLRVKKTPVGGNEDSDRLQSFNRVLPQIATNPSFSKTSGNSPPLEGCPEGGVVQWCTTRPHQFIESKVIHSPHHAQKRRSDRKIEKTNIIGKSHVFSGHHYDR
jgi:hypothetical protein